MSIEHNIIEEFFEGKFFLTKNTLGVPPDFSRKIENIQFLAPGKRLKAASISNESFILLGEFRISWIDNNGKEFVQETNLKELHIFSKSGPTLYIIENISKEQQGAILEFDDNTPTPVITDATFKKKQNLNRLK